MFNLTSLDENLHLRDIKAITIPKIIHNIPRIKNKSLSYLENIVHDIHNTETGIDLLIGQPLYSLLILGKARFFNAGPGIMPTKWGNILVSNTTLCTNKNTSLITQQNKDSEIDLDTYSDPKNDIKFLWSIEKMGDDSSQLTHDENSALKQLEEGTRYNKTYNQFETVLLWKRSPIGLLHNNLNKALGVMQSVEKKLSHQDKILMDKSIDELIENDYAEKIPESEMEAEFTHYLECFPVIKMQRSTHKCRIVFNASSTSKQNKISLNSLLLTGPNVVGEIPQILVRF